VVLNWVPDNTHSCALAVVVPALELRNPAAAHRSDAARHPGSGEGHDHALLVLDGMYTGQLVFDQE